MGHVSWSVSIFNTSNNADFAVWIFTLQTFSGEWIISEICGDGVLLLVWHLEKVMKVLKWS